MAPDWQRRRSAFNHDWLKNRFLTAVASFMNILDDLVEDPETEQRFVRETLPQWPTRMAEGRSLINDFVTEMSPKTLFQCVPLCRCAPAVPSWLPSLVHLLWCHRSNVESMCAEAHGALAKANSAYERVAEVVADFGNMSEIDELRPYRERFEAFRAACEHLSKAISRFPSRIEVV